MRKVYYNLAITGLSVAICFFIGTIEVLGLLPMELGGLHGGFWHFMEVFDINKAGFVIVGMFVVCRATAASKRCGAQCSSRGRDRGGLVARGRRRAPEPPGEGRGAAGARCSPQALNWLPDLRERWPSG